MNASAVSRTRVVMSTRVVMIWLLAVLVSIASSAAHAHGFRIGSIVIDHPYAIPTEPGSREGAVYFREIRNRGGKPDRLVEATTDLAERVVFRHRVRDEDGFQISVIDSIELAPNTRMRMRHIDDYQLQLVDLREPLEDGMRFDLELRFEHAGTRTVQVWVQQPRR